MATLAWVIARGGTTQAVVAAVAVIGLASSVLMLRTRRTVATNRTKLCRMERRVANLTGEISALRNETDCRHEMQRIWATDRDAARIAFGPTEELDGR